MIHDVIREKAIQQILFLPHAALQMSRTERMISPDDVRKVIEQGTIIEDYPDDSRGHSCLIMGKTTDNRPLHVVCAPRKRIWLLLPHMSRMKRNGPIILRKGLPNEVYALSREHDAGDSAFRH